MTLVFVYGSLMRGHYNHRVLGDATFVGAARTGAVYTLYDLGAFPAAVEGGTTSISGELYEVDGPTLERLDRLEGHPTLYRREAVQLDGGDVAYLYIFVAQLRARAMRIGSGDWRTHKESE